MKDMTRKIRSKAWMDAENRWWVADLLAQTARRRGSTRKKKKKQCQSSIVGLENGKKEDEKRKMEEMHQQKVSQMIKKCRRWCWAFTQAWRGGVQILKEIAEDAKLLDRCEAKKEERARKALAVWRRCAEHGRQALEKRGVEKDAMASTQKSPWI